MRKKALVLVLVCLTAISLFAFTACNKNTYTPPEGGEWLSRGVFISEMVGVAELRFKNDTEWEMEMIDGMAVGDSENTIWCQGTYYFEGNPGVSALHMTIDPAKLDPSNVRLVDANKANVENGAEIVYQPDENGVYSVRIKCVSADDLLATLNPDAAIMTFSFKPPQDGTPAGTSGSDTQTE